MNANWIMRCCNLVAFLDSTRDSNLSMVYERFNCIYVCKVVQGETPTMGSEDSSTDRELFFKVFPFLMELAKKKLAQQEYTKQARCNLYLVGGY